MAKLFEGMLAQPPSEYNQGMLSQLIRVLQQVLGKNVKTTDEAEEDEAIHFFINN